MKITIVLGFCLVLLSGCNPFNVGLVVGDHVIRQYTGNDEPKAYEDYDTPSYCELHPESEDC